MTSAGWPQCRLDPDEVTHVLLFLYSATPALESPGVSRMSANAIYDRTSDEE